MDISNNGKTYSLNPLPFASEKDAPPILGKLNADEFCGFPPKTLYISHVEITPTKAQASTMKRHVRGTPLKLVRDGKPIMPTMKEVTVPVAVVSEYQITKLHFQRPVAPKFAAVCPVVDFTTILNPKEIDTQEEKK